MILKSIYLENFRIYGGKVEIKIADGEKNITVIKGNNDAGKTTLMNAITWCLYGNEHDPSNQELYNSYIFNQTEIGKEISVMVRLIMEDSEGRAVYITRVHKFYKNSPDSCATPEKDFNIFRTDNSGEVPITEPENYIKTHLPYNLKNYFLFDGEMLEQFFDRNNSNIKSDVFRFSQLDLIDNVSKHINDRRKEFIDEKSKNEPKIGNLTKKELTLKENLEINKKKLVEVEKRIENSKLKIDELKRRLDNYDGNPLELFDKRDQLNDGINNIKEDMKNTEIEYKKFLFDNFSKIYAFPLLKNVEKMGKDLKEEGFIPAQYKKEFLRTLLNTEHCICGRDLEKGSEAFKEVKKLFEKTNEITNYSETVNSFLGSVNVLINNYPSNFKEEDDEKDDRISDLEDALNDTNKNLDEINASIDKISETEFRKLNKDIEYQEESIRTDSRRLGNLEANIKHDEEELKKVTFELKKENANVKNISVLDKKIELCNEIYDASKNLYNDLVISIHEKIQDLTSKEFNIYHWKDTYRGVEIDDDFNVKVIRNDGTKISATDPSAGTQLTLALSFITALNSLAGFELPIFIDTPLGRLDNDIRNNLGKFLPEYTENKQVILLVTGNEYSGEFKTNISKHVGVSYELKVKNDEGKERTEVV